MLSWLVIVPVVSLFTKAPKKSDVEICFSCYDQTVSVKAKEALPGN
jgi:SSS family solute:Na+ symporter